MDRIRVIPLSADPVAVAAEMIEEEWLAQGKEPQKLAVVFGGRRPHLFLRRELARRLNKPFSPPLAFSMDEFVLSLARTAKPDISPISDIDACFALYRICAGKRLCRRGEKFARFLPWAREILRFIELVDLEDIPEKTLRGISLNAAIGYEVPQRVNDILQEVVTVREKFHEEMRQQNKTTRGLSYLTASRIPASEAACDWNHALFCNFFALSATEQAVVKSFLDAGKGTLIAQGDEREWPALAQMGRALNCSIIPPSDAKEKEPAIHLCACADTHTQASVVREIVEETPDLSSTVVVVPNPGNLIPLLTALGTAAEFNVSLGYPLVRSAVASLLKSIFAAQRTRRQKRYYAPDYLSVLRHPVVKNLSLAGEPERTRIVAHRVEDLLSGVITSPIAGMRFVELKTVEEAVKGSLDAGEPQDTERVPRTCAAEILSEIHRLFFSSWEHLSTAGDLAQVLDRLVGTLLEKGGLHRHPPNLAVLDAVAGICDTLSSSSFRDEQMSAEEVRTLCEDLLAHGEIPFSGSPLKGLQVLGLMETRALSFKNVIVTDANESVLPAVRATEPLIPAEVMAALGIRRLEQEEEIQRYHLMRLISSAQTAWLCYEENPQSERSRFVEQIVWKYEKRSGAPGALRADRRHHTVTVTPTVAEVEKTPEMVSALNAFVFSPTALDDYLSCPMKFCRSHLFRIGERTNLLEEAEGSDIGTFLHRFLRDAFTPCAGKQPLGDAQFRQDCLALLSRMFRQEFSGRMRSEGFLTEQVLQMAVSRFLDEEARRQVARILGLEKPVEGTVRLPDGVEVRCKATIDRIDLLPDGTCLIIDYKSGTLRRQPTKEIETQVPTDRAAIARILRSTQVPLSIHLFRSTWQGQVSGAYYYLREAKMEQLFEWRGKPSEDPAQALANCLACIGLLAAEIRDPATPFVAEPSSARECAFCPFSAFCA